MTGNSMKKIISGKYIYNTFQCYQKFYLILTKGLPHYQAAPLL